MRWWRRFTNRVEAVQLRLAGTTFTAIVFRTPVALLETTGRRTGRTRRTPVAYLARPDRSFLIAGGAAGQARTPDWVANLRNEPRARVVVRRARLDVTARELDGDERRAAWEAAVARWPMLPGYERASGRLTPLFVLTPT